MYAKVNNAVKNLLREFVAGVFIGVDIFKRIVFKPLSLAAVVGFASIVAGFNAQFVYGVFIAFGGMMVVSALDEFMNYTSTNEDIMDQIEDLRESLKRIENEVVKS